MYYYRINKLTNLQINKSMAKEKRNTKQSPLLVTNGRMVRITDNATKELNKIIGRIAKQGEKLNITQFVSEAVIEKTKSVA